MLIPKLTPYCISIILLLLFSCKKQNEPINGTSFPSNAKLKRISLYASIDATTPVIVDDYEYDNQGQLSKISSPLYQNGQISGIGKYNLYEYDTNGRLLKIKNYRSNSNSSTGFINLENYIYSYSNQGLKEKEVIEYPQINSSVYTIYKYVNNNIILEKYDNKGNLESYTQQEFDKSGNVIKESSYSNNNQIISVTIHTFLNQLNTATEVYYDNGKSIKRRITKTYDANRNLVTLESKELSPVSSMSDHVLRYEYFQ
jgi:uncharacterized protein YkuJ